MSELSGTRCADTTSIETRAVSPMVDAADMPAVQALWGLPAYRMALEQIDAAERDRVFCRHGVGHLLDVARIAWILNMERGLELPRELVYIAALLHDVGRAAQYASGEPHDAAGERMAAQMLDALPEGARLDAGDREAVLAAVRGHRGDSHVGADAVPPLNERALALASLICEADNRSRPCYACSAQADCYWPEGRKNLSIDI